MKKYMYASTDKIVFLKPDGIPHQIVQLLQKHKILTMEQFFQELCNYKRSSIRGILSELSTSGILQREPITYMLYPGINIKMKVKKV